MASEPAVGRGTEPLTAEMYCILNLPETGDWDPYSSDWGVEPVGTGLQYCCRLSVRLPTRAGDGVILSVVRAFVSTTRSRVPRSRRRYGRPYEQSATQTRNGSPSTCVRYNGAQLAGRYVYPIRLACRPAAGHRSDPPPSVPAGTRRDRTEKKAVPRDPLCRQSSSRASVTQ